MMGIFDPRYDVEMSELIFTEHRKNKFIFGPVSAPVARKFTHGNLYT